MLLAKKALSPIWRAIIEFDMLSAGDRVFIGLSGGKDSLFLTLALAQIKKYAPFPFELAAYTIDPGFDAHFPVQQLAAFCRVLGIGHHTEKVAIAEIIKEADERPCFTCAYFRRAAANRLAKQLGFNKIALAHHHDDALETFLMNLLTSGQLKTFLPVTWLSRSKLHVIRPLLYYREEELRALASQAGLAPLKNPCPYDGHTIRQKTKDCLPQLEKMFPGACGHLAAAMRAGKSELWPEKLNLASSRNKFRAFWQKPEQL